MMSEPLTSTNTPDQEQVMFDVAILIFLGSIFLMWADRDADPRDDDDME